MEFVSQTCRRKPLASPMPSCDHKRADNLQPAMPCQRLCGNYLARFVVRFPLNQVKRSLAIKRSFSINSSSTRPTCWHMLRRACMRRVTSRPLAVQDYEILPSCYAPDVMHPMPHTVHGDHSFSVSVNIHCPFLEALSRRVYKFCGALQSY